jgi:hypothetical protein
VPSFTLWYGEYAPISSPPLLPPSIASRRGLVYPALTRCSAQAMKSSNTFCFLRRRPASCQAWPNSPPPRRFAIATTPPASSQIRRPGSNQGTVLAPNPPYPVRSVGLVPSRRGGSLGRGHQEQRVGKDGHGCPHE